MQPDYTPTINTPTTAGTYSNTSDIFDRIHDGSYKDRIALFSPLTPLTPKFDPSTELRLDQKKNELGIKSNIALVKEFENKQEHDAIFNRKSVEKRLKQTVYEYDNLLILTKQLERKNDHSVNGECIYMKLQIKHIEIAMINLVIQLHDQHYADIIKIVKEYEDPYNLDSERAAILQKMPSYFERFHDVLLQIQYLESEKNKLERIIQNRKTHSFKFWLKTKWMRFI